MSEADCTESDRGFPLTIVTAPCLHYKEGLSNIFFNSPVVQEALKEPEEYNILDNPVDEKKYTVLLQKNFPNLPQVETLTWKYLDEPIVRI